MRRGFTLIEIMIVLVLLGIVAAIVAPQIGGRADLKLAAAARKMVADVQYAQNLAISGQQNVYVQFAANQYTLSTFTAGGFTTLQHPIDKQPFIVALGTGATSVVSGVTFAQPVFNGASVLGFDALGAPLVHNGSAASPLTQTVAVVFSMQDQTVTLRVEPYTGEVTLD